ncbi:MAG: ORF6N domain-containing protein [Colwellia sp.]|nr:ORF6N domain-containing protein [Colwellia sp.]
MNNVENHSTQTFEQLKQVDEKGNEFWYARPLAKILDYADFRNFIKVINKAILACEASGNNASDHVVEVNELIKSGKGATRTLPSYSLSRYACYLIVQKIIMPFEVIMKSDIKRYQGIRFKLINNENLELVANCDRFKNLKHSTTTPHEFTKYGVETKSFNCAVKKNKNRFPASFRFQLRLDEYDALRRQIGTSNNSLLNRMEFIEFQQIENDKNLIPCTACQCLLITKKELGYAA